MQDIIINEISLAVKQGKKISFVSGNFNVVHPGHLRLLKFASEISDVLVVCVLKDGNPGIYVPLPLRIDGLRALSIVSHVIVADPDYMVILRSVRPHYVIKGPEFKDVDNLESQLLNEYGGKLLFSSGEIAFSSMQLLGLELSGATRNFIKPFDYVNRNMIDVEKIKRTINHYKDLKVLVVGDLIVDDYISCDALGMSQEDPTIVVTPVDLKTYIGGAGIVAAHARGLGACVSFCSVSGHDSSGSFARAYMESNSIDHDIFPDFTRPTTRKQRFRASGKTLLRVNNLRHHSIDNEIKDKLRQAIYERLEKCDVLLFSDFNYGCLPQDLVDDITILAHRCGVFVAADSQASSQISDISRFKNADLITPTEREARLAVQDTESGVAYLANILQQKAQSKNTIITLASEGMLVSGYRSGKDYLDRLPALNLNPKDPAGAGDCLFTTTSMALRLGLNIWEAALIGAVAAACQVSREGNQPLSVNELIDEFAFY